MFRVELVLLVLLFIVCVNSESMIHLQNGEIVNTETSNTISTDVSNMLNELDEQKVLLSVKKDYLQLIIQLDFSLPQVLKKTEKYYDIKINPKNYIAHDGFLIYVSKEKAKKITEKWKNEKLYIKWIGKVSPSYKAPKETFILDPKRKSTKFAYLVYFKSKCDGVCTTEMENWSNVNYAQISWFNSKTARIEFHFHNKLAINELLKQEVIEWIEPELEYEVNNYSGNSVMQHGYTGKPEEERKEIWENGITGEDQVVTVFDSGVDYSSCYFHEINKQPPPEDSCDNSRTKVIGFYRHITATIPPRKTILGDHVSGHGTHVAGSVGGNILGAASERLKSYKGAAPDCKLVIQSASIAGSPTAIFSPANFSDNFRPQKQCNSYIFTNSWGSTQTVYTLQALSYDEYLYKNDELLILFSAGNSGPGKSTVGSPAMGKNVLTIGSSQTTPLGRFNSSFNIDYNQRTNLLISLGVLQNGQDCCSSPHQIVQQLCCKSEIQKESVSYTPSTISSFSSRGPTRDGRFKPDVVNVGDTIQSANSDGNLSTFQCDDIPPDSDKNLAALRTDAGTSMATPLSAGGSALVRQYYTEGWHFAGEKDPSKGFIPSGPLLKATVIHSGNRNAAGPTMDHGFGSMTLKNVLMFKNGNFSLFVKDRQMLTHQTSRYHGFRATKSGAFKATLTWYDPPASLISGIILVNNLNLDVLVNGVRYAGNGVKDDYLNTVEQVSMTVSANDVIDVIVRAEKIVTNNQTYALVVTGDGIVEQAITRTCGGLPITDPNVCQKKGYCGKQDECVCYGGHYGPACADYQCYGKNKTDSSACNSHGQCQGANNCTCNAGYMGLGCEIPICFRYPATYYQVCGGVGIFPCLSPDKCDCSGTIFSPLLNEKCEFSAWLDILLGIVVFGGLACCAISITVTLLGLLVAAVVAGLLVMLKVRK